MNTSSRYWRAAGSRDKKAGNETPALTAEDAEGFAYPDGKPA